MIFCTVPEMAASQSTGHPIYDWAAVDDPLRLSHFAAAAQAGEEGAVQGQVICGAKGVGRVYTTLLRDIDEKKEDKREKRRECSCCTTPHSSIALFEQLEAPGVVNSEAA